MSDAINQHKRMAMGQKLASGGRVNATPVGAPARAVPAVAKSGGSGSPLTSARRNNGIPGMKKGGGC